MDPEEQKRDSLDQVSFAEEAISENLDSEEIPLENLPL